MAGVVEVKDTEQSCYYRASLLDVKDGQCLVQMAGGTKRRDQMWVPADLVREEPVHMAPHIVTGGMVEVAVKADGDDEPVSWWEATVLVIKEDFIKIRFAHAGGGETIVESTRLRPAYSHGASPATSDKKDMHIPLPSSQFS